jgi:hypothetical protein
MCSILKITSSDQQMRTPHLMGSLYNLIPILMVVLIVTELLVCEVGGDVEEGKCFGERFCKCLHMSKIIVNYGER